MHGPGMEWCEHCWEITRSQRECINCRGPVQHATVHIPGAPGGPGNAGEGPHTGWNCVRCQSLWDGGASYGFACGAHGGRDEPVRPDVAREIGPGEPLGDFPGFN